MPVKIRLIIDIFKSNTPSKLLSSSGYPPSEPKRPISNNIFGRFYQYFHIRLSSLGFQPVHFKQENFRDTVFKFVFFSELQSQALQFLLRGIPFWKFTVEEIEY